jgi:uncharacterized protein (DUF1330 family)
VPKGYVILTEAIHDRETMDRYSAAAAPTLAGYHARLTVLSPAVEVVEGEWHGTQTVVVEFDTVEQAREWYHSPAYQEAAAIRKTAADCNVVIVEGFEPPSPPA